MNRCHRCGFAKDDCRCLVYKRPTEQIKVTNIHAAWRYHDGVKWSYAYEMDNIATPWRSDAEHVRIRVIHEYQGKILKAEVL